MSEVRPIYDCGQGFFTDHVGLMMDRAVNSQYLWGFDMAGFRGLLYSLAKLMGDYNAVKKGKVGKRVARKATGKAMRKLFK
jgi:hypothetical protein